MASPCLGHNCVERRYRVTNVKGSSVTKKNGKNIPADQAIIDELIKDIETGSAEKEECPKECRCQEGTWPAKWTTLETGVTYSSSRMTLDWSADVTFTYDWECQEKSGPCFVRAPTGGKKG